MWSFDKGLRPFLRYRPKRLGQSPINMYKDSDAWWLYVTDITDIPVTYPPIRKHWKYVVLYQRLQRWLCSWCPNQVGHIPTKIPFRKHDLTNHHGIYWDIKSFHGTTKRKWDILGWFNDLMKSLSLNHERSPVFPYHPPKWRASSSPFLVHSIPSHYSAQEHHATSIPEPGCPGWKSVDTSRCTLW